VVRDIQQILKEVLSRVKPSEDERRRICEVADSVVRRVRDIGGLFSDVVVVGSAARNTNLRGSSDVDIFILFPKSVSREDMEREIFRIASEVCGEFEKRYAEHPYARCYISGVEVDLVPAYAIEPGERIISATDRTPLHQRYLEEHFPQELKDDVRLLKAFLKGIGVYGAEIRTKGFSGYLCELLIMTHGGFVPLLRAAADWKPPVRVDTGVRPARRFEDPLVVVDPVDPYRNVAAPVSLDSLAVFVAAAREFLRRPSLSFFFPPDPLLSPQDVKRIFLQRGTLWIFYVIGYPAGASPDIVWGELYRLRDVISRAMVQEGYTIMNAFAWTDETSIAVIALELATDVVARVVKHQGPPVFKREFADRFLEKHRDAFFGPYIEKGRWYVDILRTPPSPEIAAYTVLQRVIGQGSVKEPLLSSLRARTEIYRGRAILPVYVKNRSFARWLSSVLVRRPAWLER